MSLLGLFVGNIFTAFLPASILMASGLGSDSTSVAIDNDYMHLSLARPIPDSQI